MTTETQTQTEPQRLTIKASTRYKADAETVAKYLAKLLTDAGATIDSCIGAAKNRGGVAQVTADAPNAVAVMGLLRAQLDGETNGYARDVLNDVAIGAFKNSRGGMLGFVNEDYRWWRETS